MLYPMRSWICRAVSWAVIDVCIVMYVFYFDNKVLNWKVRPKMRMIFGLVRPLGWTLWNCVLWLTGLRWKMNLCDKFMTMFAGTGKKQRDLWTRNYSRLLSGQSGVSKCIRQLTGELKCKLLAIDESFKVVDFIVHTVKRSARKANANDK